MYKSLNIVSNFKSLDKQDLLLGYVSTITSYGTTISKKSSEYNPKYKKAIITKNISKYLYLIPIFDVKLISK